MITIIAGIILFTSSTEPSSFVAGHVISGVGLITLCVATAATSSTRYSLIAGNSKALGSVSYSISSKVILLAKIWRHEFKLSNRIPIIPILTALACLFLAAFTFELGTLNEDYFIPARVLSGLGAIYFTLFSIVSILESGTSSK